MPSSSSTRPAGTTAEPLSSHRTSPSGRTRRARPNSTLSRTSGSPCATTGSGTGSSRATTTSSLTAAPHGATSLTTLAFCRAPEDLPGLGAAIGADPRAIVAKIEPPAAMPTLVVSLNPCILLALAMIVGAGGRGPGSPVAFPAWKCGPMPPHGPRPRHRRPPPRPPVSPCAPARSFQGSCHVIDLPRIGIIGGNGWIGGALARALVAAGLPPERLVLSCRRDRKSVV